MSETVELAGNYAVSGGDGDPEFVAERLQEMQEETTLKQRQTAEFSEVKAKLEEKRDRQRRIIDVMDEPVEFRPVGGRVAQQAMTLRQQAFQDDDTDAEAELVDLVFDTLAEYSVDPEMDTDWWAGFPMSVVQETFESLVMADMDADDRAAIEEFRGE
jgi:hypothetical protein